VVRELQISIKVKPKMKMISGHYNLSSLRLAIIAETRIFLRGLKSGASDSQLRTIARRIRRKEKQLLQEEGAVLDPDMWRILHNLLINRKVNSPIPKVDGIQQFAGSTR
jgi:hypothetical protein